MARRLTIAAMAALAALATTPAIADPILTPLIATLIASIGLPASVAVFGITINIAGILSAVVTTAIGIGLAIAFAPRPRLPPPENGVLPVQQNLSYRIYAYGRARVAGAFMLKEEIAANLVVVTAIVAHFADGFETLYLNDDQVTVPPFAFVAGTFITGTRYTIKTVGTTNFILIGASANTIGVTFIATGPGSGTGTATTTDLISGSVGAGADSRYNGNAIYVETRQGLPTETAYSFITSLLPTDWDATHRGDGQASLGMRCVGVSSQYFSVVYPYTAPAPSVIGRWYRVFDPRDPAQDPNNSSTFKWSENCALGILHFICFSEFGFRSNYATAIAPFVEFWKQAANDCDDIMPLKSGGNEPRYRMGGWATTESARISALQIMLQSCDGFLSRRGSGYALQVGKFSAPTVILTDDDILGFYIQSDVSTEDKVNEAIAYWSDPDTGYVTVTTDPIINTSDQLARGGAPRKAQLQLTWVHSVGQASRLLKREMFRQGIYIRGTITIGWSGINASYERFISISSNSIPRLSGVVVENRKAVISAKTRTVTIDFILSGSALDDYNAVTDESAPPNIPQRPTTVGLPQPSTVSVVPELITDPTGASTVVLAVSWDEPFYNSVPWSLNYVVQWRLTDGGGGSPGPWTQQSFTTPTIASLRVSVQTNIVQSGTSLDVQVASVGAGASLSTWSATVTISTVLSNVAPAPPTWTSAVGAAGSAALTVVAPPSPNFVSVQFFRAAHGAAFGTAISIGSPVAGLPKATILYTDTVVAGSYDYFAESRTSAAILSAPAGPQAAVVT